MAVWPLCLSFFLLFALDASEAAPLTGTGDGTCPLVRQATCETESGWSAYEGRCFRFFNFQRSWIDAEKQCLGYDGNLASVHSYDEYTFIQDLIKSQTQASTLSWIGGYDAVSEGNWLWSDGSKLNLEIWAPPQPDNWNGVEHCLEMNYHSLSNWNDQLCHEKRPFVCVKKYTSVYKLHVTF
ncbi:galactose-specific lectin nattectin [Carassius gibelio]|uniref:galactose-specific lectin nattectin n=1 Tax=Carassius gibelio TaxID=101364 RepID=UPI002278F87D|nr:galactose-specific lectin nattectin [Carassius gibelio]XP_052407511.1 galactose-specific lectin nattectin [Carassius gibelio]